MRRARPSSLSVAIAAFLLAGAGPSPSTPGAVQQQLDAAERARQAELAAERAAAARAAAAAQQEQQLAVARAAALARLRSAEAATAAAADRLHELAQKRAAAEASLQSRAKELGPLLPLIERLSLYPAETLLAVPLPADDAVRGLLVLQGMTHRLEAEARALRAQQAELDRLAAEERRAAPELAAAEKAQAESAAALDRQLAEARAGRQAAEDAAAAAEKRAATQAARASDLREMLTRLEAERRAAEAAARAEAARAERARRAKEEADARQRQEAFANPTGPGTLAPSASAAGQLIAPVVGRVVRAWGDPTDAGPAVGISYRPAPAARVVSPCGGKVEFSAPFRSYGNLIIINCGGGFRAVLAGLAKLDAPVGERVHAGEPIGTMPDWDPQSGAAAPTLYVELRKDGAAVNPAPWLRAHG